MKKYLITSVIKAQNAYIEKNYEWLKELYVRKGYDSKMLFTTFCLHKFEETYLEFEKKKIEAEEAFSQDVQF